MLCASGRNRAQQVEGMKVEKEQTEAAVKIQAIQRGKADRKEVQKFCNFRVTLRRFKKKGVQIIIFTGALSGFAKMKCTSGEISSSRFKNSLKY